MGKSIEIECSTNILIDEYVKEISTNVLIEEAFNRLTSFGDKETLSEYMDVLVEAIATTKKLNIIDADRLKVFLNNLG